MKKSIYLIPFLGLAIACSNETKQNDESSDNLRKEPEVIEETIKKMDSAIQNSEEEINKAQNEIDELLNDI